MLVFGVLGARAGAAAGARAPTPAPAEVTNTEALGRVLYTDYVYLFQAAGMVLLVAMIGAIVLTLRHRAGVRRQDIAEQVARRARGRAWRSSRCRSGRGV